MRAGVCMMRRWVGGPTGRRTGGWGALSRPPPQWSFLVMSTRVALHTRRARPVVIVVGLRIGLFPR